MSDATTKRLKVSREGIVLIKSFEGFRPRAVPADTGGWIIGYGHTLSAREGLTVSEADAELLLQYDLLPVVTALNDQAVPGLNQHQFDALVSFAYSIGIDRFASSDVARRLEAGALGEAADALIGWPEPTPATQTLRRRAAERALFVADPSHAITLADLLAAPLPPPEVVATDVSPAAEPETSDTSNPRAAAVAALLGEQATVVEEPAPAPETQIESAVDGTSAAPDTPVPAPIADSFQFQRFSPYAASVVGPLPGLGELGQSPAPSLNLAPVATAATASAMAEPALTASEAIDEPAPAPVVVPFLPEAMVDAEPGPSPFPEVAAFEPAPSEPASVELFQASVIAGDPFPPLAASNAPAWTAAPTAFVPAPPLVLTPLADTDPSPVIRPVWGEQQRETPTDQDALFEDDQTLESVLRHEEPVAPRRFDWSQTGAFAIMGGVGLVAAVSSAAAFRLAIERPSPMGETTVVAWTLAVIGGICVVVSAWNLYPRLFPKGE